MHVYLFLILLVLESIISTSRVMANPSTKRRTDTPDCNIHPQRCYDEDKNNEIGEFFPIVAPKVEPRVTTGMMHYRYEDGLVGKLKGNMPFIGGGLLTSYKKWVFDMYYQTSSRNTHSSDRDVPFSIIATETTTIATETTTTFDTFQSRDMKRDDYTVSLGYNAIDNIDYRMIDNLWLFLGYRGSITDIDTKAILFGDKLGPDDNRRATSNLDADIGVETHGPFIGAMIGKRFGDSQLGINMGITRLWGKYNFQEGQSEKEFKNSSVYGYRLGIDWNAPITNIYPRITLRYNLSLNAYGYIMNIEKFNFFENLGANFPVKEEIYSFRAALLFQWW